MSTWLSILSWEESKHLTIYFIVLTSLCGPHKNFVTTNDLNLYTQEENENMYVLKVKGQWRKETRGRKKSSFE